LVFFAHNFSHLNLMLVLGCFSISDANLDERPTTVLFVVVVVVLRATKNNNEEFPVTIHECMCVSVQVFCGLFSLVCVNLF